MACLASEIGGGGNCIASLPVLYCKVVIPPASSNAGDGTQDRSPQADTAMHLLPRFTVVAAVAPVVLILAGRLAAADMTRIEDSPVKVISSRSSGLTLSMRLPEMSAQLLPGSAKVNRIAIEGVETAPVPGYPDLPRLSQLVVIPPVAPVSFTWNSDAPRRLDLPAPGWVPMSDAEGWELPGARAQLQLRDGFWPPEVVQVSDPVIMRGIRMVNVTISPVQINPVTGELRAWDNVEVDLDFTRGGVVNPVADPHRIKPSSSALQLARSIVINPDDVRRDDLSERGAYVYVIPRFNGLPDALRPLVEWRRRQGFPTAIIEVAPNASNVDVKNAIQNAYNDWEIPPEFITLVGDADLAMADFMIATWDVGRAYMWETDYKYVLLEGQDLLPEAAIGRISCRSLAELRTIVERIVAYESDPYMDDTNWYRRGAVMANDQRTGYSSYYLQQWTRKVMLEAGYTAVDTFYFMHDNQVSGNNFIRNAVDNGIAVFHYRGWGAFNGDWSVGDARNLRNGRKMPFWLLPTCNSGDFADHILTPHAYTEDFLWGQNGGCIGAVGSSGYTHTNYNNVFSGGTLNSIYRDRLWTTGWAITRGKIELYRHFGQFNDVQDPQVQNLLVWEAHAYQLNLIGDAGSEIWTDVPQRVEVTHVERLSLGENLLAVRVVNAGGEVPRSGVTVTVVQDESLLRSGITDADGRIVFSFAVGELAEGSLQLTAWQHNMFPYLADVPVEQSARFVGASSILVDDDNAGRSRGNGDRQANPGEIIELRTFVGNFGSEAAQGRLDLTLTLLEGDAAITTASATINQAPAMGDTAAATFVFTVGNENWDQRRLLFDLATTSGNETWHSPIELQSAAPNLEYARHTFTPNNFDPADTVWIDVTLRNVGRLSSAAMSAQLLSRTPTIVVHQANANVAPVLIDGNDSLATARFRIYAHSLTVPGTKADMYLALTSQTGFTDTAHFDFTIGAPRDWTPFGPDAYGYVCFDNTDTLWDAAPDYDWLEIDSSLGGPGVNTGLRDLGNEQDFSVLVDLPFGFRYYGRDFNRITVCTNGWLSFGDESRNADFQNKRIPSAFGPRAQVCAFWDDLINYTNQQGMIGGIFTYYDTTNNRFIVEWSRMRRYVGMEGNNIRQGSLNTFQALLYDPQHYPTYTGDGEIVFQYRDVSNDADVDPVEFDTPFATVGIVNLNGTDGMEYTYWNRYTAGAAPLRPGRAIKFTTKLVVVVGAVRGTVTDAATNAPIPNAQIRGSRGSFGTTDRNGRFLMENVLIGDDYSFTAWAPGYNDSTLTGFDIAEGDTINLSFSLLHPEFVGSAEALRVELRPDYSTDLDYTIENRGNGPLEFRSRIDYAGGGGGNWARMLEFSVTGQTGDYRINGVDYFAGAIWITGSNGNENPNYFYRFDRQGRYLGRIVQPGQSAYGFRGLASTETRLFGGEGRWIVGVNAQGEPVDSVPSPLQLTRAIAYDHESDHFWVANGRNEPLLEIDREGNVWRSVQLLLDIYGLGWRDDDPDGYPLHIFSRDKTNPNLEVPETLVSKFDPESGEVRTVVVAEGTLEDRAGGIEISSRFDSQKWVMLAVLNNPGGSTVSIYDIAPNTRWVSFEPRTAILAPRSNQQVRFHFTADDLPLGEYSLLVRFTHNAAGLGTTLPVTLTVSNEAEVADDSATPLKFSLDAAYPNPFNAVSRVHFQLEETGAVRLAIYDLTGRETARLIDGRVEAGRHTVALDAGDFPAGVYIMKLEAGNRSAVRKLALVK
ncbi:MAG: T9SS type A sorting domain-containing protein [Calditrichaeota bacterium]|nr:T9SS type A sorting domain-containing protein [Calditrichota bacterium]